MLKDILEDLKQKTLKIKSSEKKHYIKAILQNKSLAGFPDYFSSDSEKRKNLELFYFAYNENLNFYNCVDFTDVLLKSIELIDKFGDIKEAIYDKTKYLLVDEYQDLSPLEQKFVSKICGNPPGLCIFGDDDQSIYETFRFASPQGIIDFPQIYRDANDFPITLCRRCSPAIIEKALISIKNNRKRVPGKRLIPFNKSKKGFVVSLAKKSKKSEIEWLISKIKDFNSKGYEFKDLLILFSDGKIAKDYVIELKNANIPVDVQLKISNIFETELFLQLIATIEWLINNDDNLSLRQCLDYAKQIGTETIRQLRLQSLSLDCNLWAITKNISQNQNAFYRLRQRRKLLDFYDFLNKLKSIKKFSEIIQSFFEYLPESNKDKGCQEIFVFFKKFDNQIGLVTLKDILEDFEQNKQSIIENLEEGENEVRIMTLHSAKGCEAPIVFIPALEHDIIPGENPENLEEKRRLFYVSLTRAKVGAFLTWAKQRTGQEIHMHDRRMLDKKRSIFLDEII